MKHICRMVFATLMLSTSLQPNAQARQSKGSAGPIAHPGRFRLTNPDTMAKPAVGYSQLAEVTGGTLVYVAGQVALDRSGNLLGTGDFRAQVRQVFENIKAAVEAAGGDFHDVIKLNYYCSESVSPSEYPVVREIQDTYVNTAALP